MKLRTSVAALYGACLVLGFCPEDSVAATATDLVTICTSATTTIQASKCTAWQYNVYSPTAYIESYPTVTPAETGINDPKYEYRLGSTLTPTNGVKVCPTALTPGVGFNSPQADPCPNNNLVATSTVLPINTYAVATSPAGIEVYQVNTSGVSVVPGSPFVQSPAPTTISGTEVPSPTLTALDPAGQYLYALYDLSFYVSEAIYSFKIVNGFPSQVSRTYLKTVLAGCRGLPAARSRGNCWDSIPSAPGADVATESRRRSARRSSAARSGAAAVRPAFCV